MGLTSGARSGPERNAPPAASGTGVAYGSSSEKDDFFPKVRAEARNVRYPQAVQIADQDEGKQLHDHGRVVRRAALVLVAGLLMGACEARSDPAAIKDPPRQAPSATSAEIPQARWKMTAYISGAVGPVGKRETKRARAQRVRASKLVRRVYDAMFLDPARRDEVLKAKFHPRAARALRRKAGVPKQAQEVQTTQRKADIAIHAVGARRAVASVKVRARGVVGDRSFKIVHRGTLWLERRKGKWKVIAFDVAQRPAR